MAADTDLGLMSEPRTHPVVRGIAMRFLNGPAQFQETLAQLVRSELVDRAEPRLPRWSMSSTWNLASSSFVFWASRNLSRYLMALTKSTDRSVISDSGTFWSNLRLMRKRPTFPRRTIASWNFSLKSSRAFSSWGGLPGRRRWINFQQGGFVGLGAVLDDGGKDRGRAAEAAR